MGTIPVQVARLHNQLAGRDTHKKRIFLDDAALKTLKTITGNPNDKSNIRNIPAAYRFLREIARGDGDVQFWLGKAPEINENNPSSMANTYIRTVTRKGLAYDNKSHNDQILQQISDAIGQNVIWDVLQRRHLLWIEEIIKFDVGVVLKDFGVTIGGWGGSFNYWDFVYNGSQTVGAGVQGNGREYKKFIDVNSDAIITVLERHILCISTAQNGNKITTKEHVEKFICQMPAVKIYRIFDQIKISNGAQAPFNVKEEIVIAVLNKLKDKLVS